MASNKAVLPKNNGPAGPGISKPTKNPKRIHRPDGTSTSDQKRMKLAEHQYDKENEALVANAMAALATGRGIAPVANPPAWFMPAMTNLLVPLQCQLQTIAKLQYSMEKRLKAAEAVQNSQEIRLYHMEGRIQKIANQQTGIVGQLNKMESKASGMSDQLVQVEKYQYSMSYRLSNLIARQINGGISKLTDPIYECWNHNWEVAENFPSTVQALAQITELEMKTFLEHYNILPVPPSVDEQRRTIQRFLGIPKVPVEDTPSTVELASIEVPNEETSSTF
jgi:hypothetical protein